MKILVADDSKTNLIFSLTALEKLGHTVVPVTSGNLAFEAYQET